MFAQRQAITKVIVPSLESDLAQMMRTKLQSVLGEAVGVSSASSTASTFASTALRNQQPQSFMKVSFPRKPIQYC